MSLTLHGYLQPDEREEKLPSWAKALLVSLRRTVSDLARDVVARRGEKTDVTLNPLHHLACGLRDSGPLEYLPDESTISFILDGQRIEVRKTGKGHDYEGLYISSQDRILVEPRASNVVIIQNAK